MAFEMIDGDEGPAEAERDGLRRGHADDQAADETRPGRRGHRIDRGEIEPGLSHGLADRRIEQLDMGAGGDLGHHAAIGRMQVELRAHHACKDLAPPAGRPAHHGGRGLIAARLDPEHGKGFVLGGGTHGAFYSL